jgi:hypothetical protein
MVFRGGDPLWVDITSVSAFDPVIARASLQQFISTFLNPLVLLSRNQATVVRALLTHSFGDIPDSMAESIISLRDSSHGGRVRRMARRAAAVQRLFLYGMMTRLRRRRLFSSESFVSSSAVLSAIEMLRNEVAAVPCVQKSQEWSDYVQSGQLPLSDAERRTRMLDGERLKNEKVRVIATWLSRWKSESTTLLDLACNKGFFAQVGCLLGYAAAGVDSDEGAVEAMFADVTRHSIALTTVVNDLAAPREAAGMTTNRLPSLQERLGADVVIMLATAHHLRWGCYQMNLERIAMLMRGYARRFAIIEFVPATDSYLSNHYPNSTQGQDYSEEAFGCALARDFEVLAKENSFPAGRKLWILRKKGPS